MLQIETDLFGWVVQVFAERQIDLPFLLLHDAVHQGTVPLLNGAFLAELRMQVLERGCRLGKD